MPDYRLDIAQLDTLLLDGDTSAAVVPSSDDFYFGTFGLQNSSVLTEIVRVSAPSLDLSQRGFARESGVYAESAYHRQNRIFISGTLKAASRVALEELMDDMREALSVFGATMKITWGGVARYYDDCYAVNLENLFKDRDHYHIDWCPFEFEVVSQHPFARSEDRVTFDAPYALTAASTTFVINNAGTAKTDPIISLAVATAGTLSEITVANQANGDSITFTGTFNNGDAIEINGEEKTVTLNGAVVSYAGVIPKAEPGNNIIVVTLTGSGFSVSLTENHYSRYH